MPVRKFLMEMGEIYTHKTDVGGIHAELLNDVVVKLHPLTDRDARELVGSVRMAKLFSGFRGTPPSDTQSLEELLLRISALVEDIPELAELDLNPVKVMAQGKGYWVVMPALP